MTPEQIKVFQVMIEQIRGSVARGLPVTFDAETAGALAGLLEVALQQAVAQPNGERGSAA